MQVLAIDSERRMLELLTTGLREQGFTVTAAPDGINGLALADQTGFDAIVLEIALPGFDGYQVLAELRQRCNTTPVLFLSARNAESDIVRALDLGADDYLTKPFSFPELAARLHSIRRRARLAAETRALEAGEVIIDPVAHTARRGSAALALTRQEFRLLLCLAQSAGRCLSRIELANYLWGNGRRVSPGALDVLVNALRAKLDAGHSRKLLLNVRGKGYLLRADLGLLPGI